LLLWINGHIHRIVGNQLSEKFLHGKQRVKNRKIFFRVIQPGDPLHILPQKIFIPQRIRKFRIIIKAHQSEAGIRKKADGFGSGLLALFELFVAPPESNASQYEEGGEEYLLQAAQTIKDKRNSVFETLILVRVI
jgi:hypothetical protein